MRRGDGGTLEALPKKAGGASSRNSYFWVLVPAEPSNVHAPSKPVLVQVLCANSSKDVEWLMDKFVEQNS